MDDNKNPTVWHTRGGFKYEEWHDDHGEFHRVAGPATVMYNYLNVIIEERWFMHGRMHCVTGPAMISYNDDSIRPSNDPYHIIIKQWFMYDQEIEPPFDNYPLTKEQQIELKLKYS